MINQHHTTPRRSRRTSWARALILAALFAVPTALAGMLPLSQAVAGRPFSYTIQPEDTLSRISSFLGVERHTLAGRNGLNPEDRDSAQLIIGERLKVDNRYLVPPPVQDGLIINLAQRRLYLFRQGQLAFSALIAVGSADPQWQTPSGDFKVISTIKDKTWVVPKSIQEEMRRRGEEVLERVPPGPDNPLGGYWIGLSLPNIGIHGTLLPESIFNYESHGCMRMRREDIETLFSLVKKGDQGRVIYAPVMVGRTPDNRVWLEVHPDVYGKGLDPYTVVREQAEANGLSYLIDWDKVPEVIARQEGVATDISLHSSFRNRLENWLQLRRPL